MSALIVFSRNAELARILGRELKNNIIIVLKKQNTKFYLQNKT